LSTSPSFREVGDGVAAIARLAEVESTIRPRVRALTQGLDALEKRLNKLETALARADDAAAGVLLDELRLAEQRVGSTEMSIQTKQEELKLHRGRKVGLERERGRLLEEQAGAASAAERAALATRTAHVLAQYEDRLLHSKLEQLRSEFVRRFNQLAR